MTQEIELLSSCIRSREAWATANDLLDFADFSQLGNRIFKAIGEYYTKDEQAQKADFNYVYQYASRGMSSDVQKEQCDELIKTCKALEVSPKNVIALAIEVRRKAVGIKLAEALVNDQHDDEAFAEYTRLVEAEDISALTGDELNDVEIDDLFDVIDPKNKIKLYPPSLNERLDGGVVPGDAIIVAGRPNAGKSAFVITQMAGMAARGYKVLYAGNEDAVKKIIVRVVSCLTGLNSMQMMEDPKGAMDLARKRGYGNIVFSHPVLNLGHLSNLVRRHKPTMVVVDQLRNMKVNADNRVGQLEASAIGIRNVAAEHKCVTIGVTQAGDSAEGKLKLGMGDIDGSKTGIQGACDIIVMIGVDPVFDQNNSRMLNTPKNKGGRHDSWPVKIDPYISRYYDE